MICWPKWTRVNSWVIIRLATGRCSKRKFNIRIGILLNACDAASRKKSSWAIPTVTGNPSRFHEIVKENSPPCRVNPPRKTARIFARQAWGISSKHDHEIGRQIFETRRIVKDWARATDHPVLIGLPNSVHRGHSTQQGEILIRSDNIRYVVFRTMSIYKDLWRRNS